METGIQGMASANYFLEKIEEQLQQLEALKWKINYDIKSALNYVSHLGEKKEKLMGNIREEEERVSEINVLVPKLTKERTTLQDNISNKRVQVSQITDQINSISSLTNKRTSSSSGGWLASLKESFPETPLLHLQ